MTSICSITSSWYSAKDMQETEFSKIARVAGVIGGIVAIVIAGVIAHRGQLAVGLLAGGISFICVAALIKCVKKTQSSNLQADTIPEDIWFKFFTFLNISDLGRSGQVSKKWKAIIDERIWPAYWKKNPDVYYDFKPFVDQGRLTWKQVGPYAHFSVFLRRINERLHINRDFITSKNPKLNYREYPHVYIPMPWVSSGCYNFWIEDSCKIKMQNKDNTESHDFVGENEKRFCCLAVEGPFLFALRVDGLVVQWNYLTKEKAHEFATGYFKEEPSLQPIKKIRGETSPCESQGFHVQEGYLVLKYGDWNQPIFEIISYHFPNDRWIIEGKDVECRKIFIHEDKIYILGQKHIYIRDIKKNAQLLYLRIEDQDERVNFLDDCMLKANFIYAFSTNGNLYKTDLSSGNTSILQCFKGEISRIITLSNKFFYYLNGTHIYMRDLRNKNYTSTRALFNTDAQEVRAGVLDKLIKNEQSDSQVRGLDGVD